jgi:ribosomal protein L11 methyltransferase
MKPKATWKLVTLEVLRDAEEDTSVLLFELGSTGIVTMEEFADSVKLGAYFDAGMNTQEIRRALDEGVTRAGLADAVRAVSVETVLDQDWMKKWKEGLTAVEVGSRLVIAPSWNLPEKTESRVVIQIDPGMAFGTGTHESTRLCLEAIERYWQGGRLLDVGTGTGILAIAAALLAPGSPVVAIDVDPQAVEVARENAEINGVSASVELQVGEPGDLAPRQFDVVVANLTAEVIVDLMKKLSGLLSAEGLMILSGILNELSGDVKRALAACDLKMIDQREDGEWTALIARATMKGR